jgi:hypothetical protein
MFAKSLFNLKTSRRLLTTNLFKFKVSNFSSHGHNNNDKHAHSEEHAHDCSSHSQGHGHDDHGNGQNGHGSHDHGHHEVTGEVDLNRVYVPLSKEVYLTINLE